MSICWRQRFEAIPLNSSISSLLPGTRSSSKLEPKNPYNTIPWISKVRLGIVLLVEMDTVISIVISFVNSPFFTERRGLSCRQPEQSFTGWHDHHVRFLLTSSIQLVLQFAVGLRRSHGQCQSRQIVMTRTVGHVHTIALLRCHVHERYHLLKEEIKARDELTMLDARRRTIQMKAPLDFHFLGRGTWLLCKPVGKWQRFRL